MTARRESAKQTTLLGVETAERAPELVMLTIDYRGLPLGSAPAADHVLIACPVCGLPSARIKPDRGPVYYLHAVRIHATRERRKVAELDACRPEGRK